MTVVPCDLLPLILGNNAQSVDALARCLAAAMDTDDAEFGRCAIPLDGSGDIRHSWMADAIAKKIAGWGGEVAFAVVLSGPPHLENGSSPPRRGLCDLLMWARCTLDVERLSRGKPRAVMSAAEHETNPVRAIEGLCTRFGWACDLTRIEKDSDCPAEAPLRSTGFTECPDVPLVQEVREFAQHWIAEGEPNASWQRRADELFEELDRFAPLLDKLLSEPETPAGADHAVDNPGFKDDREGVIRGRLGRAEADHLDTLETLGEAQDKLKDVTRKYRQTRNALDRLEARFEKAKAGHLASEEHVARLEQELASLRSMWWFRLAALLKAPGAWLRSLLPVSKRRRKRMRLEQEMEAVWDSGLFDAQWYLASYPDVAELNQDPLEHYMLLGWRENRDPGPDFSGSRYLRDNPDIAQSAINPLLHFIEYGEAEGRGKKISKLNLGKQAQLPNFALPAPVFQPQQVSKPAANTTAPAALPTGDELESGLARTGEGSAVWRRFRQISGIDPVIESDWNEETECPFAPFADAWFIDSLTLRIRVPAGDARLIVCQADDVSGQIAMLATCPASDADTLCDVRLRTSYGAVLFVNAKDSESAWQASILAFPSLLRGGCHHRELLADVDASRAGIASIFAYSGKAARSLAKIRSGKAAPLVSCIELDLRQANGAGRMFDAPFRSWLRSNFGVQIAVTVGDLDKGEQFLASAAPMDGNGCKSGTTLRMHGDAFPTIAVLCAQAAPSASKQSLAPRAASQILLGIDASKPAIFLEMPIVELHDSDLARFSRHALQASVLTDQHCLSSKQPAAILGENRRGSVDTELLFPIAPAISLAPREVPKIAVLIQCITEDRDACLRTINSLAMQTTAGNLTIALIGKPHGSVVARCRKLFGERVIARTRVRDALDGNRAPLCAVMRPGVVLHDARTLGVLAELVSTGAASATCPIVRCVSRGNDWQAFMIDNGLVMDENADTHSIAAITESTATLLQTYPVRAPVPEIWLASAESVGNWAMTDRAAAIDPAGLHWCSAATTATFDLGDRHGDTLVSPPPAAAGNYARARVLRG